MSLRLIDQITGFCKATNDVLDRHMATFGKQDMTGLMTDYAPDAVMFTPNGLVRGTEALRKGFEQLFAEWGNLA